MRTGRPGTPWEYRELIWNFTRRDLKSQFKGTALGWVWSLIAPLTTIVIYSVVFSAFIRVEPPPMGNGRAGVYVVWLICGMVTWQFMNQVIGRGMASLLSNGALLRKVYFPSFVPVLAVAMSIGLQSLIELGIVLVILLAFLNVSWTWLLVPLWLALLMVFTTSIGYALAVANVHRRDLSQIVTLVMQLLFFLSPVIYPITLVPEQVGPLPARMLLELNPFGQFIIVGRQLLYELTLPSIGQVAYLVLLTGAVLLVARRVYRHGGQDVGEYV